ncbi:MAG: glycosyltransferase family 2 protein [Bacteroidales bacterium]|jgi:glycosyltransferase involved in cell wall biosynthesis|nr:glycosyltransferase family 2 protein [Bacteroidales bacterium]
MNINYSIIIPHKNIPDLLQRCLNSIPRREDVQIIVVDDNSDAQKVDFENFPGLNDPFVEVIFGKNENGRKGAGYARNLGLERATGKWIVFADADDCFTDCFNETLDVYKDDEESDAVFFLVTSTDLERGRHIDINNDLHEIKKHNNWNKFQFKLWHPYGKFIKHSIITNYAISFPEIQCSEDVLFSIKTNFASHKKKIDNTTIYCITERENSLVTTVTVKSLSVNFKVRCTTIDFSKKIGINDADLKNGLYNAWLRIFRKNKLAAIKLLPQAIKRCDLQSFVFAMTHNYPKLKRYWLWEKLQKIANSQK